MYVLFIEGDYQMLTTVQIWCLLITKKKSTHSKVNFFFVKATTRFELVMTVLQTGALPLG